MGWTVILEDARKERIASLDREFYIAFRDNLKDSKLLCYLDPYGDTFFNRLQIDDLIKDLRNLEKLETNTLIDDICALAVRCKEEIHSYLVFYGD
ncbi:MAG: hypothetical protein ABIN89_27100 [Chitinophagaceae bacterium]